MDGLDIFNVYIMGSIEMLTVFHFFTRFLKKKVKFIYYILFAFLGMTIMMFFPTGSIMELLVYVLLLMAGGFFICRTYNIFVGLYAVVMIEIMHLCYGVFNSISCILSPLFFQENPKAVSVLFMVMSSILALVTSVLCYQVINKNFSYDENVGAKYVLLILIPTLVIFLVSEYISSNIYGHTITIQADGSLPSISPFPLLFIQILGIASLFCIMFAYKKLVDSFKLSRELSLLELEKHSLNQYVEEAKVRYEKTKAFRHDVKNHISIVKELVQNGDIDTALQYMSDMENLTADMSFPVSTNNPVLDILIGNKLGIAKSNQIEVQCSFISPYPCGIADIDFCIIFSNALDNAISACNRVPNDNQKYIHITGKVQGDFLLIEIINSHSGRGSIRSGTGLANIKAVAEKYHGAMEVAYYRDMSESEYERLKEKVWKGAKMKNGIMKYHPAFIAQRKMQKELQNKGYNDIFISNLMVLSPTYAEYKKALDNLNDRMCRELGLYYDSNYNLVIKKDNSK